MKAIRIISAALAALVLAVSCDDKNKVNPNASNERSIISIKLQGQLGEAAEPEVLDDERGAVAVQISTALCPDMSKVRVEELVISYKAKASVEVGGTLDLSSGHADIVVTAESGKTRTYTVTSASFTESFAGCYAVKNTALLGGVGDPSWGGVELIDPIETKSWLFTESIAQGVGPAASNDDYFEITLDKVNSDGSTEGSCVLYGGVDGKHWDCMYKTEYDLKDKLRVIPLGTSHWKRVYTAEGSTITFYGSDGKETGSCAILEESKELYVKGDGTARVFTLEAGLQALAFTIQGDYSWPESDQFTDIMKFVRAPRFLFVRVQKVDAIPAASKTTGTMGNVTVTTPDTPVTPDPGTDPDPVDPPTPGGDPVSGTYKVANLKVLGGLGSTGLVEIKDKSWMWNGTVNNEYDNILEVKATAINGTSVTGTADYQAGADGKFWDRVLVADKNRLGTGDVNLSANFDQLPHGQSNVTLSLADGSATVGSVACKAMLPGTYPLSVEWAYASATLTVPENSIALAFQCSVMPDGSYTWDAEWAYTDFERFMIRPLIYVMIFTRQ